MSAMQRSLVLIKPDAVRRGLIGRVLSRYEDKGLAIVAMQLRHVDAALADAHYVDHVAQDWYPGLRTYITSGPVVALVLQGAGAIDVIRTMNGATNGAVAAPGSIRGDFCISNQENVVHASDSPDSAAREISLWFPHLT